MRTAATLRRPVCAGLALFGLAVGLLSTSASPALAYQATKPAKRDSSPRAKPKEATFKATVSPADARPGDTVTYTVKVDLQEGWHVYAFSKTQPDDGPRSTQFDFFDRAGLKVAEDWKPDRAPEKKKDPAFEKLEFVEFYEQDASWKIVLQVPKDAKAGVKTLRCQAYFQICNEKSCKPPTYHTLPDVKLNVKAGGSAAKTSSTIKAAMAGLLVGLEATPTSDASTPSPKVAARAGSVQESIDQGLLPFMVYSALGGLFALLMPCVWPMVPITVNFFVKQGQIRKGGTTGLAITYCLAIIAVFTLVGVVCAATFSAGALTRLGSNAWINLFVAVVFFAFGLSLLGLFEISLPNFVANASSKGESRGGLIGVVFMALTLTITSFTCTFPVVGGLLVIASRGSYLYPIIGLATFSTVLALPFFVLALAPGLLSRMPKSGDWMNAVKVVGGLVEIAAAFKFVNTAEISFGTTSANAWFDAQVVLSIWVVLALVCGIYLLGLFRTNHDYDAIQVGPGRILSGSLFLIIALYFAPALFGFPPQSKLYNRIVGILPADSDKFDRHNSGAAYDEPTPTAIVGRGSAATPDAPAPAPSRQPQAVRVKATSKDPKQAIREEKTVHGVQWGLSYDDAVATAKATNRPVFIDFTGVNCANCRTMERSIMPRPDVVAELRKFVTVQLYTDIVEIDTLTPDQREDLARDNLEREIDMIDQNSSPYYVILSPEGEVLSNIGFDDNPSSFIKFLKDGLAKFEAGHDKVATADAPKGR